MKRSPTTSNWPDVRHEIAMAIHCLTVGEDFSPSGAREFLELAQAKIREELKCND